MPLQLQPVRSRKQNRSRACAGRKTRNALRIILPGLLAQEGNAVGGAKTTQKVHAVPGCPLREQLGPQKRQKIVEIVEDRRTDGGQA